MHGTGKITFRRSEGHQKQAVNDWRWYERKKVSRVHITGRKYEPERKRETTMKYLFAWGLGVPGVLIVAWFLMNHH
jgi:hypothetical protein